MMTFAFAHSGNCSMFFDTLKINFTLNFSLMISSFSIALVIAPSSSSDAVEIHFLKIMILRNYSADKA